MIFLVLIAAIAETPSPYKPTSLCDGIAKIELATLDRPLAFKSLVATETRPARVRNREGVLTVENRLVTVVKPLEGLADCQFIYNASISLACYGVPVVDEADESSVIQALSDFSDEVAKCLKNEKLTRRSDDFDSAPYVAFAGGAKEPFYQISMVPLPDVSNKRRPELLVLAPAELAPAPASKSGRAALKKATPETKRR